MPLSLDRLETHRADLLRSISELKDMRPGLYRRCRIPLWQAQLSLCSTR